MTDEQIKRNAEEYADVFGRHMVDYYGVKDAFIEGAHSRDEEIEDLENGGKDLIKTMTRMQAELDKLRNPWISVEDDLPDEFKKVIVMFDSGIIIDAFMTLVKDEPAWHPSVEIPIGSDVIFWMPRPEIKKGE